MTATKLTSELKPHTRGSLIATAVIVLIVYGSLYPFEFRAPPNGIGPVATFLSTWNERPGRGDFIANILFYAPLGFFVFLGLRLDAGRSAARRLLVTVVTGALLSLSMELTQYYDEGRVTSATDFYSNTIGTLLGSLAACAIGTKFRLPFVGEIYARPIPSLLIFSWLLYRFYPYVPTIDLHKYWNAVKPILVTPSLSPYDLFRQTAIWLTLYALIGALIQRRSAFVGLLFALLVMVAKVLIIGMDIRIAELAGAGTAFMLWVILLRLPGRVQAGIAGLVLCGYVAALRLEPFQFQDVGRPFGWIPFLSFMQGWQDDNTVSFLEKFFLYGSMLYLLGDATGRRLFTTSFVAALLFATSWAETYLPGRSAEITDMTMALMASVIFALMPLHRPGSSSPNAPIVRPAGDPLTNRGTIAGSTRMPGDIVGASGLGWRDRELERRARRRRPLGQATGDIEDY